MKIFLIINLLAGVAHAAAPKVLLQSEDVSKPDYQAFIKSEPSYKTVVDDQIDNRIFRSNEKELIADFDKAERSFLGDTVESAHLNYKRVTELALANDWTESERKLIFHCYLRAAQTAVNDEKRLDLLIGSVNFDSRQTPDEKLFPPPLVAEWQKVHLKNTTATLQLSDAFQKYDTALVNGVRVDFKRFAIRVPHGSFRLTLLSNQLQPISKVATVDEFKSWNPQSAPFVAGTCEKPNVASSAPREAVALFPGDCVSGSSTGTSTVTATEKNNIATNLFDRNLPGPAAEKSDSVFKKPMFWGIAGAAVAFLAYSANQNKSDPAPTHKTGF